MRQTRDPITSLREKLVSSKLAEADELKKIELDARKMVRPFQFFLLPIIHHKSIIYAINTF
jgi:TPP-dependent pyruvate/acetoin dehydrogenase alpha subunit